MRCVNGLEDIQGGQILLRGEPILRTAKNICQMRQKIGMVFQSYDLFPHKPRWCVKRVCTKYHSARAMSLMTSPARINPAVPGTKGTEPGICRLPVAAASSSQPVGFMASSWE